MHISCNWWCNAVTLQPSNQNSSSVISHYRKMFPGGVNKMNALDQDLSAAPPTVKIDFRKQKLETLRKIQQKISSSATAGMVQGPLDTTGQQADSSLQNPPQCQSLLHRQHCLATVARLFRKGARKKSNPIIV